MLARCAWTWRVEPEERVVPAPGPQRDASSPAADRGRLARRGPPARRARVGPRAHVAAFEIDLGAVAAPRRTVPDLRDLTSFPARAPGPRRVVADDVAAARVLAVVRERGRRRCSPRRGLRRLPRRAGGGGPRVAGAASRVPRAGPHAHRRGRRAACATGSSPPSGRSWGASSVAERRRPRRRRLRRRARRAADRPPSVLRARGRHGARGRRPAARRAVPAPPRRPGARRATTPTSSPTVDAAIVAYPHGAAAPVVAALRERGMQGRGPQRRLPAARPWRPTSAGTPSTPRPELIAEAVYGLPERYRDADRAAPTSSRAPAATRPPRCSRSAPLRAGLIGDVVHRRQVRRLRRGPRRPRTTTHFVSVDENVKPYRVGGPPPHARDRAGARRRCASRSSRTCVPLDQGELVSLLRRRRADADDAARLSRRPTPTSRSSSWWTGRPAYATCARRTTAASTSTATRDRPHRVRGDRQPLEGHGVAGGAEPQPDARAARDRGAAVSAFFRSRWVEVPDTSRERRRRAAAGLPRRRRRRRDQARGGRDVGLLVCDAPGGRRAPRASPRSGVLAAPVLVTRERTQLDAPARRRGELRQRQRRDRPARAGRRREDAGRRRDVRGRRPRTAWRSASTGVIGVQLDGREGDQGTAATRARAGADGDAAFGEAIMTTDAFAKRCSLEVRCRRHRPPHRPGQGRRDDPAELRDDAVLRADGRRAGAGDRGPAARRVREALVRPHHRRRPALDERHRDPDGVRRQRRARRARVRGRAALRRGAGRAAAPARAADRARRRGRQAHRPGRRARRQPGRRRPRRARRGQLPARQGRAARRRPELGPDRPGGRRGAPGSAPLAIDVAIEGMQVCSAGFVVPHDQTELAARVQGDEVEYVVGLQATGTRPRSSSRTSPTTTCASTPSTRLRADCRPLRG